MMLTHIMAKDNHIVFDSKGSPSIAFPITPRSITATAAILKAMKNEFKIPTNMEPVNLLRFSLSQNLKNLIRVPNILFPPKIPGSSPRMTIIDKLGRQLFTSQG